MIVIAIGRSRVRTQPYPLPSKIHNAFGPFAALTRTRDFVGIPKASTRIRVALERTWPLAAIASQASDVCPKGIWSLELALSQAPSTLPGGRANGAGIETAGPLRKHCEEQAREEQAKDDAKPKCNACRDSLRSSCESNEREKQ